ncbi:MAG: peptidase T [Oscillospiraceae bacterium]|nr:peptidase T [Oscillospiraceae bacterium]
MKAYERFINYAKVHTASDDTKTCTPSTDGQYALAYKLADEMKEIGLSEVYADEYAYVYGVIPASEGLEDAMSIGVIAHIDTIPDFPGRNVKPRIVENYDGGDIVLGDSGRVLSPKDFPHLPSLIGRSIIVTDGTTVLGADDKAGIAEIMEMAERIIKENIPHGRIAVCFCPDEEIGHGASLLDLERFGAKVAYTADGGAEGGIEYENFNACGVKATFNGFNVHPGSAKDTMINASLVAMEFNAMLPAGDTPRDTEGYEGFFHMMAMNGGVEKAELDYIVRDHDAGSFEARKACMLHAAKLLNNKYGEGTVALEIKEQYRNMCEKVKPHFHVVENALEAIRKAGLEPVVEPIRGGTDGAQLTFRGLPCPNLGTGGYAYHGPYEHISIEGMEKSVEILLNIVERYAK